MTHQNFRNYLPQLQQIWDALVRRDDIPEKVDAIVVGGYNDEGLAKRAAELYHKGSSDLVVVSGYQPEDMDVTEAEFLANKCIELGVPTNSIVQERYASNTGENIKFSAKIVNELKPDAKKILLIHIPSMSLRFLATAEAQWPSPQPDFYVTCQPISFEEYWHTKGLEATAWDMLGDFKRMDEYVEKGYQTQKMIPKAAHEAYQEIISSGFDTR